MNSFKLNSRGRVQIQIYPVSENQACLFPSGVGFLMRIDFASIGELFLVKICVGT